MQNVKWKIFSVDFSNIPKSLLSILTFFLHSVTHLYNHGIFRTRFAYLLLGNSEIFNSLIDYQVKSWFCGTAVPTDINVKFLNCSLLGGALSGKTVILFPILSFLTFFTVVSACGWVYTNQIQHLQNNTNNICYIFHVGSTAMRFDPKCVWEAL